MGLPDVHRDAGERGFTLATFAEANGVPSSTFHRHARSIGWDNYHRGLWVPTGVALSYQQRIAAALAVIEGDVLVTGASGLLLHGVLAEDPDDVELLLPAVRRLSERLDVCLHRTRMFDDVRFQTLCDAPVAAVPRLFADYATHSNVNDLCRDLATALRLRKTTLQRVARELEQRKRFPGRTNLRLAHGYVSGEVNHSNSERLGKQLLTADGLDFHRKPLLIEHQGRLIAELDIPFPDLLYAVEIDGPHHLLPHVAAADRQRDRLLGTIGWRIDRFFWFEIEQRGAWFVSQVRTAVSERAAAP